MPLFEGTSGNDLLNGSNANDTILGEAGDDDLRGLDGDDILDGGPGNDTLYGMSGADTLIDGLGSDVIVADTGDDVVEIGPGDPADEDRIFLFGGNNRVSLGTTTEQTVILDYRFVATGIEAVFDLQSSQATVLHNTTQTDRISNAEWLLNQGALELVGTPAGDLFDITAIPLDFGDFAISPGQGVDAYSLQNSVSGVTIDFSMTPDGQPAPQGAQIDLRSAASQIANDGFGNTETVGGTGDLTYVILTERADSFVGGSNDEVIEGLAGFDTINSGAGRDVLTFQTADYQDLTVDLQAGSATGGMLVAEGAISLAVTYQLSGIVDVHGSQSNDVLRGDAGDNYLLGQAGNDTLEGLDGADTLVGGSGDDVLSGGNGADNLRGDAGNDALNGGGGDDFLTLSLGADTLVGGDGSDTLILPHLVLTSQQSQVTLDLTTNAMSVSNLSLDVPVIAEFENVIFAQFANSLITGTDGSNSIDTFSGNDTIFALGGNDLIRPSTGEDIIDGGAGFDTLAYIEVFQGQTEGVTVTFQAAGSGQVTNWQGQTDTFTNVESIIGSIINDTITGASGNDSISAEAGDDSVLAGAGDDRISPGEGADFINGGAGIDTLTGLTDHDDYTLLISEDDAVLIDRRTLSFDGKTMVDMERLEFEDGVWNLDKFDSGGNLTEAQLRELIEVYIAYYNRAPDSEGLAFWANALAEGMSLAAIAADFFTQPETQATYADLTNNTAFAQQVYQNVLGRVFDADGLAFWVGVLDGGQVSKPAFILELLKGAKAAPPEDATQAFVDQQLADREYLSLKTTVGIEYAVDRGLNTVADARAVMDLFDGTQQSVTAAMSQAELFLLDALADGGKEFLVQITGVIPFTWDQLELPA